MGRNIPLPSREYLMECFEYDIETGILYWKHRPVNHFGSTRRQKQMNTCLAGKPAGSVNGCKVLSVKVKFGDKSVNFLVHRIIFKIVHNEEPPVVDHKDGVRTNNKLDNLRAATDSKNAKNRKMHPSNKSGLKGVSWDKDSKKWRAQISVDYKKMNLGRYDTKEAAYKAYCEAAIKYHKEFARFE